MYKLIYLARRNPQVSRADWPRTWRSHAVFASKFPALEARIEYLRYCNRVDPSELAGISTDHDGVAIGASDTLDGLDGAGFSEADRARIEEDELRVFDMPTPAFTYYCTEHVIRDGKLGEAALFRFLAHGPDMTRDDFDLRFDGKHAETVEAAIAKIDCVTRYVHNRPVHEPRERFPFHGISECWFASVEDAMQVLRDGAMDGIARDIPSFCKEDESAALLTSVCHRWPRD